ncbi:unnamed protein product [Prunus armeniaca]
MEDYDPTFNLTLFVTQNQSKIRNGQGRSEESRFGHQDCKVALRVPSGKMTWIRDGPKFLNAKNITEAIDGSLSVFGLQTDYIDHWPDRFIDMNLPLWGSTVFIQ